MSANSRSAALVMVGGGGQDPGGGIGELPARGRPSRQSASQVTPLTLSCITCGAALPVATQPTRWPRYCSSACRQRAYRQRQAAAVAQDGGAGGARLAIP